MSKWADRAKKLSNRTIQSLTAKSLEETIEEAKTVTRDIRFIMESSGISLDQEIGYDDGSMNYVEQHYRSAAQRPSSIEFGIDNFERLLSLYLGQSFVERNAGEWVQYKGKYHVVFPIVIRLNSGLHVDVFLFCRNLYQKQVNGSQSGHALTKFIENADRMAFP